MLTILYKRNFSCAPSDRVKGMPMLKLISGILLSILVMTTPLSAAAKRYRVEATAVCSDCGDATPVPFRTTGKGYRSKAACDAARREIVEMGRRKKLKINARCIVF
jgi:hypothetical protein